MEADERSWKNSGHDSIPLLSVTTILPPWIRTGAFCEQRITLLTSRWLQETTVSGRATATAYHKSSQWSLSIRQCNSPPKPSYCPYTFTMRVRCFIHSTKGYGPFISSRYNDSSSVEQAVHDETIWADAPSWGAGSCPSSFLNR